MKKVKVTKKPKSASTFVLVPSIFRMYFIYVLMFVFAYAFGLGIRFLTDRSNFNLAGLTSDWWVDVLIVFVGPLLLAFMYRGRWTLKVQGREQVEGPTGAFSNRISLPIREINWYLSRRSLDSRLGLANGIYAGTQRILLNTWFYEKDDYVEFLDLIGYNKTAGKT